MLSAEISPQTHKIIADYMGLCDILHNPTKIVNELILKFLQFSLKSNTRNVFFSLFLYSSTCHT